MSVTASWAAERRAQAPVPSPVLATLLFLLTEVMLFCGLISAHVVLRAQAGPWPPAGQPRLPVETTALNTLVLLVSGVFAWRSVSAVAGGELRRFRRRLAAAFGLGATFLVLQGAEWVQLVGHGLTSSSSLYGSLFYTLVGCHALHVAAALVVLAVVLARAFSGRYGPDDHAGVVAMRLYWTFVVAVWPPLYALVYLW